MKLKVALRNLYISQTAIILFLLCAYFVWFPYSFSKLGGFYKTAYMLIFVDLVLGPLLVFLIYKESKKYLAFDMNVLLSIQLIAFIFGAYSLFLKHPAYVVFSIDRFVLTNVNNIYPKPSWSEQLKSHFFSAPIFVIAKLPKGIQKRNQLAFDVILNGKPDIDSRPEYFYPFYKQYEDIMDKSINLSLLLFDTQAEKKLLLFTQKHNRQLSDFAYFPLTGNNKKNMLWAFDKETAKPIGILDIDPWKLKLASKLKTKKN